jgi:hypothetical protein
MQFSRYVTQEGFPGVSWEQDVLSGATEYTRQRSLQRRVFVLAALAVGGLAFGAGQDIGVAAFVGLIGGAVGMGLILFLLGKSHIGDGRTPGDQRLHQLLMAQPIYRREWVAAEVQLDRWLKMVMFVVVKSARGAEPIIQRVPLLSFAELELGTDQEWFRDVGKRELDQMLQVANSWVIVAQPEGHGVLAVARSARDKAGMAHLHQVLRQEFIDNRAKLVAKAEELCGDL